MSEGTGQSCGLLSALEAALPRRSAVLWALTTAGRRAPREALRPIAAVLATEYVAPFQLEDSQVVVTLICLSERPLVPALAPVVQRWVGGARGARVGAGRRSRGRRLALLQSFREQERELADE